MKLRMCNIGTTESVVKRGTLSVIQLKVCSKVKAPLSVNVRVCSKN